MLRKILLTAIIISIFGVGSLIAERLVYDLQVNVSSSEADNNHVWVIEGPDPYGDHEYDWYNLPAGQNDLDPDLEMGTGYKTYGESTNDEFEGWLYPFQDNIFYLEGNGGNVPPKDEPNEE